ncbi:MAG: hypothetical protein Q9182_001659 [Xanthomendoza sp. 2 TL-2023]
MDDFFRLPPVSRTWTASTFITSCCIYGGIINGGRLLFWTPYILKLPVPEIWHNRRKKVNFFIIQLEAKWLPWAMLLGALVLGGGPYGMIYQGTGLIAAHLYDFLTRLYPNFGGGRNYIQTPTFITRWFGGADQRTQRKGFGTAFAPQSQQAARPAGGFSTAFSSPWSSRGQGRRLGSD